MAFHLRLRPSHPTRGHANVTKNGKLVAIYGSIYLYESFMFDCLFMNFCMMNAEGQHLLFQETE